MFKLLVLLALAFVSQAQLAGGFTDRPDLIRSPATTAMIKLAVTELANGQNLRAIPVNVISVASQVVNGVNYRVIFTARSAGSANILTCTSKIYQSFSGAQSVSSVTCA